MSDLNSTLFYKIGFTIEGRRENTNLLKNLLRDIYQWLIEKRNKRGTYFVSTNPDKWIKLLMKAGNEIKGSRIYISSECCHVDDPFKATYWACKIVESPRAKIGVAPREWTTEIGFVPLSPGKAKFSCVIAYRDEPGFLGETQMIPPANIPNIIPILKKDPNLKCYNGSDSLTFNPKPLKVGDFKDFWGKITNPERSIPYIYVSPNCAVNYRDLAEAIGGNALVFFANDPEVYDEMSNVWVSAYRCENGALRVYMPNVDIKDYNDQFRHRFFSVGDIERLKSAQIVQILRRAIAQDNSFYNDLFRTEDCKRKREAILREQRIREILEEKDKEIQKTSEEKSAVENTALSELEQYEKKAKDAESLSQIIDDENHELKETIHYLKEKIQRLTTKSSDEDDQSLIELCNFMLKLKNKEPKEIVDFLITVYKNKIDFTEKGLKSLKDCEIPPDELFKALHYLSTTMHRLYLEKGSGDIYKKFTEETGIEATRGEGSQTRKNKDCMDQRNDVYNEHPLVMEPHLKLSNHQRIHFAFCDEEEKVVVGWCAGHLDTSATKKMRKR